MSPDIVINNNFYQFNVDEHKFEQIKYALEKITNGTGPLIIGHRVTEGKKFKT